MSPGHKPGLELGGRQIDPLLQHPLEKAGEPGKIRSLGAGQVVYGAKYDRRNWKIELRGNPADPQG